MATLPFQPGVRFFPASAPPVVSAIQTGVPLFAGLSAAVKASVVQASSFSEFETQYSAVAKATGASHDALFRTVRHFFENRGERCYIAFLSPLAQPTAKESTPHSLQPFEDLDWEHMLAQAPDADLIALPDLAFLCAPPQAEAQAAARDWTRIWAAVLRACERQLGVFALLDPPADPELARACVLELAKLGMGPTLAHAAAYWPHLETEAATEKAPASRIPPSGAIAAVMQRTDRERGIWKAPANVSLTHVVRASDEDGGARRLLSGTDTEIAVVNLIRSFAGRGVRVWGCRTLLGPPSPRGYIQVVRTLFYIEKHLSEIGRFVVFEPNNEVTWLKFKGLANAWLRQLWLRGALAGERQEDAFALLLGLGESMSAADVQAGVLVMRISVALHYPAEFIELQLRFRIGEHGGGSEASRSRVSVLP